MHPNGSGDFFPNYDAQLSCGLFSDYAIRLVLRLLPDSYRSMSRGPGLKCKPYKDLKKVNNTQFKETAKVSNLSSSTVHSTYVTRYLCNCIRYVGTGGMENV
jgi:hypothetical protein